MATPHIPPAVKERLAEWLRSNAGEVSRGMSVSEACLRASKHIKCRINRQHMEDAALAAGFHGFRDAALDKSATAAATMTTEPPKPAPPISTPKVLDDEDDEVIELAVEFKALKRKIMTQTDRAEASKKEVIAAESMLKEVQATHQREAEELRKLLADQTRGRPRRNAALQVA